MTRSRWVPLAAVAVVVGLAGVVLAIRVWQASSGAYVTYIAGIWLALASDLTSGLFYRDLISPTGYGGTRYFPLFFLIIGGFMRLGLPPLAAGVLAATVSGVAVSAGLARIARALGLPTRLAWLAGAAALSPYLVQQNLFEIRADALAAGLNLLGVAAAIRFWHHPAPRRTSGFAAATWFALAIATKVTSVAIPASLVAAFVLSRRPRAAIQLAVLVLGASTLLAVIVVAASHGRALESWQATMLANADGGGLVRSILSGSFVQAVRYSHLLNGLFWLSLAALGAAAFCARSGRTAEPRATPSTGGTPPTLWVPLLMFLGSTASTIVTLSSPGTVSANHTVEWVLVSLSVLLWTSGACRRLSFAVSTVLAGVVLTMTLQNAARILELPTATRDDWKARQRVVNVIQESTAPVLAESPLWPVLAGRRPFVLDPFSLRLLCESRPDVAKDLADKLDAHYFRAVVLELDPRSARSRGFYQHVHFGEFVFGKILANYRLQERLSDDAWLLVPANVREVPDAGAPAGAR
ncbi:MAG: hypothetical protein Q7V01_10745 [Vicinamibacterales bacterium]|nr:hypothetical protein [Vicinamibacterales bacterium]